MIRIMSNSTVAVGVVGMLAVTNPPPPLTNAQRLHVSSSAQANNLNRHQGKVWSGHPTVRPPHRAVEPKKLPPIPTTSDSSMTGRPSPAQRKAIQAEMAVDSAMRKARDASAASGANGSATAATPTVSMPAEQGKERRDATCEEQIEAAQVAVEGACVQRDVPSCSVALWSQAVVRSACGNGIPAIATPTVPPTTTPSCLFRLGDAKSKFQRLCVPDGVNLVEVTSCLRAMDDLEKVILDCTPTTSTTPAPTGGATSTGSPRTATKGPDASAEGENTHDSGSGNGNLKPVAVVLLTAAVLTTATMGVVACVLAKRSGEENEDVQPAAQADPAQANAAPAAVVAPDQVVVQMPDAGEQAQPAAPVVVAPDHVVVNLPGAIAEDSV